MKNWLRVTICIALVVSVLAMSLSVFAVDPTPLPTPLEPVGEDIIYKFIVDYMIETLNSWGIWVTEENLEAWSQVLLESIFEYLDDTPSIGGFARWILPWAWSSDYWGNLVGNNSFLEDMEDFANWLVYKFQLQDNSVSTLPSNIYKLGGTILCYTFPIYGIVEDNNHNAELVRIDSDVDKPVYVLFNKDYYNDADQLIMFTPKQGGAPQCIYHFVDMVTDSIISGHGVYFNTNKGQWKISANSGLPSGFIIQSDYAFYDSEDIDDYLETYSYVLSTGLQIHTDEIILPSDDPSYNSGDSITIVDGEPVYVEITWPESVEVNNLPAVVSTNTIENPHLEEAYRPIQGLITYAKDGVAVCTALLYELPDELVYLWYGVIASIIIWGMIKLMREH